MHASRCSKCGAYRVGLPKRESFDVCVAPGTRHHTLFNSNEPPEESESTFIQSVLSQTNAPLACLDDEISKLREKLKLLEEERVLLFSYRTRNEAILSPLRRMPLELLREIFLWTLPSIAGTLELGRFDMAQSPWVLTQISGHWRAVALSTPSLWSRVAIDYSESSKAYSLSLVEAQLQRCQKLKIHFYASHRMDSCPQIRMFRFLSQHSSRWEELSIGLTSEIAPLLTALRDRIPFLKRLWIHWTNRDAQIGMQSIDCFHAAPCPVDTGIFNEYRVVPVLRPVHQLTRYELDCPWGQHRCILKQAPNLVEARICIFDEEDWPDSNEIISLFHLRRLYVTTPQILKYLKLPVLGELALGPEHPDLLRALVGSLLDRSSCSPRRLSIVSPTAHTTVELLQSSPSITELLIVNGDEDNDDGRAQIIP